MALTAVGLTAPMAAVAAADCDAQTFADAFNGAADGETVALGCDVTITDDDNLPLAVAPGTGVTLNLSGHTLDVTGDGGTGGYPAIAVPDGAALTIDDASSPSTGQLNATTLDSVSAAIGGDRGDAGSITINAGTITASGGYLSAGIGGGFHGAGGDITINGGTVTATSGGQGGAGIGGGEGANGGTVVINGGTVTATGQVSGAGIGGGLGADGGAVTINGGTVTATSTSGAGIGAGRSNGPGPTGGSLTIAAPAQVTVASDRGTAVGGPAGLGSASNSGTLILPEGMSIDLQGGTLTNDGVLSNAGTITGTGTVAGTGSIDNAGAITHTVTVGDGLTVTDHIYAIALDENHDGSQPTAASFNPVYAPTLADAGLSTGDFPADPVRPGYQFTGWNTAADGSGQTVTDSTAFAGSGSDGTAVVVTLFAQWTPTATATVDRYVATDGSNSPANDCLDENAPCRTISYAVGRVFDATPFNPDETIHVAAGTYPEFVIIAVSSSTDLTIVGAGTTGANRTVIAGSTASPDETLRLRRAGSITLRDLVVAGNPTGDGVVVYPTLKGDLTITGSEISGNGPDGSGDGIDIPDREDPITVTIQHTAIDGNGDSGIEIGEGPTTAAVTDSTISNNGYGIVITDDDSTATVTVSDSTVSGNAEYGVEAGGGSISLTSSAIAGNGVGVAVSDGATVDAAGTTVSGSAGPAADVGSSSRITVSGPLTVSGTIVGAGTIDGTGTLVNHGAIWRTVALDFSEGLSVTDHHYRVSIDANGGQIDWGGATPWSLVDGPTLAAVGRSTTDLPAASRDGYTFDGWQIHVGGTDATFTDATEFPGSSGDGTAVPVTVTARWAADGPDSLYAYPNGAATAPISCPEVTDLADGCTLEQALAVAQSGDTVVLAADPDRGTSATFTTATGWAVPQDSLTIQPDAGVRVTLDGQHIAPHLLDYTGSGTLSVTGLTLANTVGSPDTSDAGGGIINRRGTLAVADATFSDNDSADGYGGGIMNWTISSQLAVTGSTFTGNDVTGSGMAAAVVNIAGGNVTVAASTFVDNHASSDAINEAAGILNGYGHVAVTASTFVTDTGEVAIGWSGVSTTTGAGNLFAGAGRACVEGSGTLVDAGYNITDDDSCGFTDSTSVDGSTHLAGLLNDLADNGGPTRTIALKPGSPAIDMIPPGTTVSMDTPQARSGQPGPALMAAAGTIALCPRTDQRGVAGDAGAPCHAGAVQAVAGDPLAVTTDALPDATAGTGYGPVTLAAAGGTPPYTWAVSDGTLPAGLELDAGTGRIAGEPTAAGTASFTVVATDANLIAAVAALSITVTAPAPPSAPTPPTPPNPPNPPTTAPTTASAGPTPPITSATTTTTSQTTTAPTTTAPTTTAPTTTAPTTTAPTTFGGGAGADPTPSATPGSTTAAGQLPSTGVSGTVLPAGIAGLALVVAGGLVLSLASRRRNVRIRR